METTTLGWDTHCKRNFVLPAQVFSFKLRGAFNKMASLSPEQLARGVITSSAGNHAQGLSLAAAKLVSDPLSVGTCCSPLSFLKSERAVSLEQPLSCFLETIVAHLRAPHQNYLAPLTAVVMKL